MMLYWKMPLKTYTQHPIWVSRFLNRINQLSFVPKIQSGLQSKEISKDSLQSCAGKKSIIKVSNAEGMARWNNQRTISI